MTGGGGGGGGGRLGGVGFVSACASTLKLGGLGACPPPECFVIYNL